jgi:tRNA threonylcarbamoyladenosine biosynthesis protein TsaE
VTVPDALLGRREVTTPDAMEELGRTLGAVLAAGDLVVLTGALGAGKTTLSRGLAAALGVRGPVQSPTFVIARTHPSLRGGPALLHVDAYRLSTPAELDDLDLDLDHAVTVVEWGRDFVAGLRERWWEVEIERPTGGRDARPADAEEPDPRVVTISRHPASVAEDDDGTSARNTTGA